MSNCEGSNAVHGSDQQTQRTVSGVQNGNRLTSTENGIQNAPKSDKQNVQEPQVELPVNDTADTQSRDILAASVPVNDSQKFGFGRNVNIHELLCVIVPRVETKVCEELWSGYAKWNQGEITAQSLFELVHKVTPKKVLLHEVTQLRSQKLRLFEIAKHSRGAKPASAATKSEIGKTKKPRTARRASARSANQCGAKLASVKNRIARDTNLSVQDSVVEPLEQKIPNENPFPSHDTANVLQRLSPGQRERLLLLNNVIQLFQSSFLSALSGKM
mmetsp:Transcript_7871/g.14276  ORF Transcript_7871/g.14276 Transcript_7871/m.14276 type:complete len:273 (-) Transcript_7871:1188-2006(-)